MALIDHDKVHTKSHKNRIYINMHDIHFAHSTLTKGSILQIIDCENNQYKLRDLESDKTVRIDITDLDLCTCYDDFLTKHLNKHTLSQADALIYAKYIADSNLLKILIITAIVMMISICITVFFISVETYAILLSIISPATIGIAIAAIKHAIYKKRINRFKRNHPISIS